MVQWARKWGIYLFVIFVMISIFQFSAQPATSSKALSDQFVVGYEKIVEKLPMVPVSVKTQWLARSSHYVRKLAHFTIYALLGSLIFLACCKRRLSSGKCLVWAMVLCILYAITDEWHQYDVPGRGAQLSDVLLDSLGAIIGILFMYIIRRLIIWNKAR